MPIFRIPSTLREHCGGHSTVEVEAPDLGAAMARLEAEFPGCATRIARPDGRPREFVRIFVNDEPRCVCHETGLALAAADTISIVPAVPGG